MARIVRTLVLVGMVWGMGSPAALGAQNVAEVDAQPRSLTLAVGERKEVLATAYDARGNNILSVQFTWQSTNPEVVRVEEDRSIAGVAYVIGTGAGSGSVRVSVGGQSRTITVQVAGGLVSGPIGTGVATVLEIDPLQVSLLPSEDIQLRPRFLKDDGTPAAPTQVTWRSFNSNVASVDAGGTVVGIQPGNTLIEASTPSGLQRRITVQVANADWTFARSAISLSPTLSDTVRVVIPAQNNRRLNPRLLSWRSGNPNVVAVSPIGVATGVSAGRADVTAIGLGQQASVPAVVHRRVEFLDVQPAQVDSVMAPMGGSAEFRATPLASDETPVTEAPVLWDIGDTTIIALRFDGGVAHAQGKRIGSTILTARTADNALSKTWIVNVVAAGLALNANRVALVKNGRFQLRASFADQRGTPLAPATSVSWLSTNPQVARVDGQGMVTAGSQWGTTQIVANTPWGRSDTAAVFIQGEILVTSNRGGTYDIYAFDRDDPATFNPVVSGPGQEAFPRYSPDGTRVLYATDHPTHEGNFEIYVADADGGNVTRLTDSPAMDATPTWTPDGRQIVYTTDAGGLFQIWIMNADGSNPRQLTQGRAANIQPVVSPDGRTIAFSSNPEGNYDILLMNLDGSNVRNFTRTPENESLPFWVGNDALTFLREARAGRRITRIVVRQDTQGQTQPLTNPGFQIAYYAISGQGDLIAAVVIQDQGRRLTRRLFLIPVGQEAAWEVPRQAENEELLAPSFRR